MAHASQRQSRAAAPQTARSASQERYWETVLGAAPSSSAAPKSIPNPTLQRTTSSSTTTLPLNAASAQRGKGKTRSSPRLFECSRCDARFERRGHLQSHINTVHERKRPFQCPRRCGKVFAHRSSLNRHLRITHGCEPDAAGHAA